MTTARLHAELAEVESEIAELSAKLAPIQARLSDLNRKRSDLASRLWIEENGVKRDDVEMSTGEGKPWFGDVYSFGRWMKNMGCGRPYAEWNHRIYQTFDLMNGRMPDDIPGHIEDLP